MLTDEFDFLRDGTWLGRAGLKPLLIEADIDDIAFITVPPGYAYLSKIHTPPDVASFPSEERRLEAIPPAFRDHMRQAHDAIGLPLLSAAKFRFILEEISNLAQDSVYDLSMFTRTIRDKSEANKIGIGRNAIGFVVKAISVSGHRFEPDLPQDSAVLAQAFCASVIEGLRRKGFLLKLSVQAELREYLSGGLCKSVAQGKEEPAIPPIAVSPESLPGKGS